jgi:serine kinase of HPr protein (carbohydrate metabolism regulator)
MTVYLTNIKHDFNFNFNCSTNEILHTIVFQKIKIKIQFPIARSHISFHPNQGRNIDLIWNKSFLSSVNTYTLIIENIIEFSWKQGSKIIQYRYLKDFTNELVHYWLLHTFLPLYYTLGNMYDMLHVGAIEIKGKACLFAAPSFGGKSTLTHYFLQKGHTLLSDDKLALFKRNDMYFAAPSYPYVRNYREVEDLGRYTEKFSTRSLPIGCVYRLVQVDPEKDICICEVKGYEKFSIIEMSSDIKLSMLKQKKFASLYELAQKLPIYEISIPQGLDRLEEVYDKIVEHFDIL